MADRLFILDYLYTYYDELTPKEFYQGIFPGGELAKHNEKDIPGKYNAVAVELLPKDEKNKSNAKRFILTDEMDYLDELLKKENFIIISPISYCGRSREAKNARFIYAMAIDLDGIETEQQLTDLFFQIDNGVIPKPTYIVWSGTGIHLYFVFEKPIPCFDNITKQLAALKNDITKKIWNKNITTLYDKPQLQSLFQGFRMCGGVTKGGNRTRAFLIGEKTSIEILNRYAMRDENQVKEYTYKSNLTLKEAAAKYPSWYEKRIVKQQPKGKWICKKDLYYWWLNRVKREIISGHRYYGIMCLAIYAKKSGVSYEELEKDAFELLERMEELTTDENNHFSREDILAALELYNDNYFTFPIDTIKQLTALDIKKNKRNGRKQADHIEYMNTIREFKKRMSEPMEIGRPTKEKEILEWRRSNPNGTKADCIRELQISKPTVYKYWNTFEE